MDARRDWMGVVRERGQRAAEIARTPLNTPRRLYLTGFVLALAGFLLGGLIDPFWRVVLVSGLGVICVGFLQEIWTKTQALLASSTAHKVVGALGGVVISLPCYILAHQSVNRITGLSPESFPYSTTLLAIAYALPVILTAAAVLLGGYSILQMLFFIWHWMRTNLGGLAVLFSMEPSKANKVQSLLHVSRMIAAFTLMFVFFHAVDRHDQAEATLQPIRTEVVVHADYYSRSPCRNVAAHERVAFLKDGKISIATREAGRWRFRLADCKMA